MSNETEVPEQVISTEPESKSLWDGGKSPMKSSYGKLMMWFLIVSDSFTFAGALIAYAAIRAGSPSWPAPEDVFNTIPYQSFFQSFLGFESAPLIFVTFMTFLLILSSVFVVRAVIEGKRMNQKGVLFWLFLGILGGAGFLACQAWEWSHLIHQGMTLSFNPFGTEGTAQIIDWKETATGFVPVFDRALGEVNFGQFFFFITGFHGFHVTSGLIINIIVWIQASRGVYQRRGHYEMVEKVGLYWHFVDLVWVLVFLAFYLM